MQRRPTLLLESNPLDEDIQIEASNFFWTRLPSELSPIPFKFEDGWQWDRILTEDAKKYINYYIANLKVAYLASLTLDAIQPDKEENKDETEDQFGILSVSQWTSLDTVKLSENNELTELCQLIQECFDEVKVQLFNDTTDMSPLSSLITTRLINSLLEQSAAKCIDMSPKLSLYYILVTVVNHAGFRELSPPMDVNPLILPPYENGRGLTSAFLHEPLAYHIKTNYDQPITIESGGLQLLSGLSNVVKVTPNSRRIAAAVAKLLSQQENSVEININHYLLYLTLEIVCFILKQNNSSEWSCCAILDAINLALDYFQTLL